MEDSSDILWRKYRSTGDEASFRSLFDQYYQPLCRYSCFFTQDRMDSEEVVLDFFLHIWSNRDSILLEKSFEAYARVAIHNRSLNRIRSRRNMGSLNEASSVCVEDRYDFDTETLMKMAWEAASSIPGKGQEIFRLSRQEGLSNAQIAQKTGLSLKTVEGHMTKALKHMRFFWSKNRG